MRNSINHIIIKQTKYNPQNSHISEMGNKNKHKDKQER